MATSRCAITEIVELFQLYGEIVKIVPYGHGHIHDTYVAEINQAGARVRYIVQRINHRVFTDPPSLMDNIARVTAHLQGKTAAANGDCGDRSRRALMLVPTRDDELFMRDADGCYWRLYLFIEGAQTFDQVSTPEQAYAAAQAFGRFQRHLADLPAPRLHDTIPGFHDTPQRIETLKQAIEADKCGRADSVAREIDFVRRREAWAGALEKQRRQGILPERITHNDTKLNNVMLDNITGEGICVIDLDTVMPGLAAYDFGDLVRSAAHTAPEDTLDLDLVTLRMPIFSSLAQGYHSATEGFLTPSEVYGLVLGTKLITFETGIRFLTDFLVGDTYFKTNRPGQNLDRCRVQFRLVTSIESQEDAMLQLVNRLWHN